MADAMEIIISAVDSASDVFESIIDSASSMASGISDAITGASSDFDTIADNVSSFSESVDNVDDSTLEELAETLGMDTDRVQELLQQSADIGSMSAGFNEVASAAEETGEKIEETTEKVQEFGSAGDVAGSELLLNFVDNLANSMENLADRAGNVQDSLNRMGLVADGVGLNVDSLKGAISDLAAETGRSGGTIRESFISMMSAGVTDIEDMTATFEGASAQAYLLNTDVSALAEKFTGMAMKSKVAEKTLKGTGITVDELGQALGLQGATIDEVNEKWAELDTSQRAATLGIAASMNEGETANEAYKNSWQGLHDQIDIAKGKIMTMAGNVLLPVFVPAMQLASDILSDLGSTIDGVMKGPWGGLVSIIASSAGAFAVAYGGIMYVKDALAFLKIESLITGGYQALLTLQQVLLGETSLAAALGLAAEGEAASLASVSFFGLSLAELAALWPLALIVAGIVALVAVVYEVGKAFGWWTDINSMIDAVWAGIQRLWNAFINHPDVQATIQALTDAWNWFVPAVTEAGQAIMNFFGINESGNFDVVRAIIDGIGAAWDALKWRVMLVVDVMQATYNGIITVWTAISGFIMPIIGTIITTVTSLINIFNRFRDGQISLPDAIIAALTILWNGYQTILTQVAQFVLRIANRLIQYAVRMGTQFVNNIINRVKQLPGKIYSALIAAVSKIASAGQQWIKTATNKAKGVISGVKTGLSGIGSAISGALGGVVSAFTKPFSDAYNKICDYVDKIKDKASDIPIIGGAFGGDDYVPEGAMAGVDLSRDSNITTSNGVEHNLTGELTLIHDLRNLPKGITAEDVANLINETATSDEFGKNLARNMSFQEYDLSVKQKIIAKTNRARGI